MDFQLSPEQVAVQDSLDRFIASRYGFEHRRQLAAAGDMDASAWDFYAELGLLALPIPESAGGLGGNAIDLLLVMQKFGRGLMLEPYLETAVLGRTALSRNTVHAAPLEELMAGSLRLAWAHAEPDSRHARYRADTVAHRVDGAWHLKGRKSAVAGAPFAQKFVVSARVENPDGSDAGMGLFLADSDAPGVRLHPYSLHDGTRVADIVLADVRVQDGAEIALGSDALECLDETIDLATIARCGEAVGAMDTLLHATVEHLQGRRQFGQPLSQFQALRHRVAEMAIHLEEARAIALLAAAYADHEDARVRRKHVAAAKLLVSRSAQYVGQQAVQLHGAMGLTDEFNVGHYFKRLVLFESSFGDSANQLDAYVHIARRQEWANA